MSNHELKNTLRKYKRSELDKDVIYKLLNVAAKEKTQLQKKELMKYKRMEKDKLDQYRKQLACLDYLILNIKKK